MLLNRKICAIIIKMDALQPLSGKKRPASIDF